MSNKAKKGGRSPSITPIRKRPPSLSPGTSPINKKAKTVPISLPNKPKSSLFTPMKEKEIASSSGVGISPSLFEECNDLISNGNEINQDREFTDICNQLKTYSVEDFENIIVRLNSVREKRARAKYNYLLSHVMNECFNRKEQLENNIKKNHKDIERLNILENFSEHVSKIEKLTLESSKQFMSKYKKNLAQVEKLRGEKNFAKPDTIFRSFFTLSKETELISLEKFLNENRTFKFICSNYEFFSQVQKENTVDNQIEIISKNIEMTIQKDPRFNRLSSIIEMTRNNIIESSKSHECGYSFYDLHGLTTQGDPVRYIKYILDKIMEDEGENSYFQLCPGNSHGTFGINFVVKKALKEIEKTNTNIRHYKPGKRIAPIPYLGKEEKSQLMHVHFSIRYGILSPIEREGREKNDAVIVVRKGEPSPGLATIESLIKISRNSK